MKYEFNFEIFLTPGRSDVDIEQGATILGRWVNFEKCVWANSIELNNIGQKSFSRGLSPFRQKPVPR